jgi:hypothetical protein
LALYLDPHPIITHDNKGQIFIFQLLAIMSSTFIFL